MGSSESPLERDPRDWELLASLFGLEDAYRHKMGLRRFPADEFYAPTTAGPAISAEKEAILIRTGERHMFVTSEGHAAAAEFARLLGITTDGSAKDEDGEREFNRRLSLALEPDLLLVQPPDWPLIWANVCFPSRWSLEGKSRRPLIWIHEAVPGLNTELAGKFATFFSRLPPGEGWRRANWGLSASAVRNQHPDEPIPKLDDATGADQIFVRIEGQHLLKLPVTGAIAFGIRIASFAWTEVMAHPSIAVSILTKLQSIPLEIARYKGFERVIPSIMEKHRSR